MVLVTRVPMADPEHDGSLDERCRGRPHETGPRRLAGLGGRVARSYSDLLRAPAGPAGHSRLVAWPGRLQCARSGPARQSGVSPARLASLHRIPDRQLDQLGMDSVADSPYDFLLDRVGLAAGPTATAPPRPTRPDAGSFAPTTGCCATRGTDRPGSRPRRSGPAADPGRSPARLRWCRRRRCRGFGG
jgi:hypothetical protein